ncbi:glycoside hydrolase family 37 protein [Phaeosphaeria sp. MPI-PUGE-AT-0046c]|nr:glycoside hydrolase family 37 protein [Phaeosphaeria sp. MPI-PUGE-AT-0046c]
MCPSAYYQEDNLSASAPMFLVAVESTISGLLQQEDTNKDGQITIDDKGSKVTKLLTLSSGGSRGLEIRGNYELGNLLQRLCRAKEAQTLYLMISGSEISELPVVRLARLIKTVFWNNLIRRLDAASIQIAAPDSKDYTDHPQPRIYVPHGAPKQIAYYIKVAQEMPLLNLDVQILPKTITNDIYRQIIQKPGLLALEMEEVEDPDSGGITLRGLPFVVPGGCFNELYNWDSYFIALGLLVDGKIDLVKSLVSNFIFEVQHYGLIPNANRSYYLLRSQPPFLTDLALRTYECLSSAQADNGAALDFLRRAILAAMKEYHSVWVSTPRLDKHTGLSRYRPDGVASPPECTLSHFAEIFKPFAAKHGLENNLAEFRRRYDEGHVSEPELDEYFLHDRSVRESGHDISLRVEGCSADLATVDLNSLLYKYEKDIAHVIRTHFNDALEVPSEFFAPGMSEVESSAKWERRALSRKRAMNKFLWDEEKGTYFDYNTRSRERTSFETVTASWTLWCGGSESSTGSKSRGRSCQVRDAWGAGLHPHQWDYPCGWAPHQVMAWDGLRRYGYYDVAERLAYRWLYVITKTFVNYNGAVVEKYDVTQTDDSHKVDIDYGNQGLDFQGYAKEGFGWTNASYVYGWRILPAHARRALSVLAPWEDFAAAAGAEAM